MYADCEGALVEGLASAPINPSSSSSKSSNSTVDRFDVAGSMVGPRFDFDLDVFFSLRGSTRAGGGGTASSSR